MGAVVNGWGRIFATRARMEKNDPAAMNSAKHIRHRWRARRGPPRGMPNRMMRTSPVAARMKTVARKKYIGNGTPLRKPPGRLKAFTPRDVEERESDRDRQQGNIDTSSP